MNLSGLTKAYTNTLRSALSFASEMAQRDSRSHPAIVGLSYMMGAAALARFMNETSLAETLESSVSSVANDINKALAEKKPACVQEDK